MGPARKLQGSPAHAELMSRRSAVTLSCDLSDGAILAGDSRSGPTQSRVARLSGADLHSQSHGDDPRRESYGDASVPDVLLGDRRSRAPPSWPTWTTVTVGPFDYVKANVEAWEARYDDQLRLARRQWTADEPTWGIFAIRETIAGILPAELGGAKTLELGCGTSYVST